jgi:hypothetical protein
VVLNNGGNNNNNNPEERGYMEEECGNIAGRALLYFCTENSGLPKLLCWSQALRSDQKKTEFPTVFLR